MHHVHANVSCYLIVKQESLALPIILIPISMISVAIILIIYVVVLPGCGTGVTCPANKSDTAFCDMCDYNSDKTCASVQLFDEIYPSSRSEDDSSCPFGNEVIYIGEGFAYTGQLFM